MLPQNHFPPPPPTWGKFAPTHWGKPSQLLMTDRELQFPTVAADTIRHWPSKSIKYKQKNTLFYDYTQIIPRAAHSVSGHILFKIQDLSPLWTELQNADCLFSAFQKKDTNTTDSTCTWRSVPPSGGCMTHHYTNAGSPNVLQYQHQLSAVYIGNQTTISGTITMKF